MPITRLKWLDTARGITLIAMIIYHFCFDLIYFNYPIFSDTREMNHHLGWLTFRATIVASFILISGISLGISPPSTTRLRTQQLQLGSAAIVVSFISYLLFPATWIDFGILHFFCATRLLYPLLHPIQQPHRLLWIALGLGILSFASHPFFNAIPWRWLGFTTFKPATEDYVPLLPWLSFFLLGLYLSTLQIKQRTPTLIPYRLHSRLLNKMGQHSLAIYLIHQPILWGLLYLFKPTL